LSPLSLLALCVAITVHTYGVLGVDLSQQFPLVWGLHLVSILSVIPIAFEITRRAKANNISTNNPSFLVDLHNLKKLPQIFPLWVLYLGVLIMAYVFINFALFVLEFLNGGVVSTKTIDGIHFLAPKGGVLKEISQAQFDSIGAWKMRGFSGHWIYFLYIAFVCSTFRKK
jgi:hypothetical protein